MAKRLDQILVIDVESTCWEGDPPSGQQPEIIEIGLCPVEVFSAERQAKRSILVSPECSSVSTFCTSLTTLTQEQVGVGVSFKEECTVLRKEYSAKERTWASYGDYDRQQFERQCARLGIGFPFGPTHINVKNLFAIAYGLPHEVGMAEALDRVGLPLEGRHHRGDDDAWNIAGLLSHLLSNLRQRNHTA